MEEEQFENVGPVEDDNVVSNVEVDVDEPGDLEEDVPEVNGEGDGPGEIEEGDGTGEMEEGNGAVEIEDGDGLEEGDGPVEIEEGDGPGEIEEGDGPGEIEEGDIVREDEKVVAEEENVDERTEDAGLNIDTDLEKFNKAEEVDVDTAEIDDAVPEVCADKPESTKDSPPEDENKENGGRNEPNNNVLKSMSVFGAPAKKEKGMFKVIQTEKCAACQKTVYAMEKLEMNGHIYHKNCFKCSHCSARLTPSTFSINEGIIYCVNHFKQLFARKGNYDEGFGRQQYKKKWQEETKGATA